MFQIRATADDILRNRENPTHGSVWMVQTQPTQTTLSETEKIPHTEVCGWFRPNLHRQHSPKPRKSHTRKCVDCSDPTYSRQHSPKPRIPHTEVCGWFRPNLHRQHSPKPRIPHTEVCGWFRPNLHRQHSPKPRKSHTRKCVDCSDPASKTMPLIGLKSEFSFMGHSNRSNRLDLNNPHTSVCGIFSVSESLGSGRLDLNNPHTSVCGILSISESVVCCRRCLL